MGRAAHCTDEERLFIRKLRESNKTIREIAEIIGCSIHVVSNALKPKKTQENRGAKPKTSKTTDHRIGQLSKKDPFLTSRAILKELNVNVSAKTIQRRLIENNLHGRIARKVPLLTKRHLQRRLQFAKNHDSWRGEISGNKWNNILWSDETKVNLINSDGRVYVRRPINKTFHTKYTKKTVKHGGGNIMVWGCFSWNGVGPIFWIKERMNATIYIQIMEEVMLPYAEWNVPLKWIFQQDNDPKHTSHKARKWFSDNHVNFMDWPAQSPDLNPIENLWNEVKKKLGNRKFTKDTDLWESFAEAWYSIPVETCRNLIRSMPNRMAEVLKNDGATTKY